MATYNGSAYVEQQVKSILGQLDQGDELVVVDDCSTDSTTTIVSAFQDSRIRLYRNAVNRGHVRSFEHAISLANNPIIMLADQDDLWLPGRVSLLTRALLSGDAWVVTSNSAYMDRDGAPTFCNIHRVAERESRHHVRNVLRIFAGRSAYYGCAMAFRKCIVPLLTPIPRFVESHDLWIAMMSNVYGKNVHVSESTLVRRIHGGNASLRHRTLYQKVRTRMRFVRALVILCGKRISGASVVVSPDVRSC